MSKRSEKKGKRKSLSRAAFLTIFMGALALLIVITGMNALMQIFSSLQNVKWENHHEMEFLQRTIGPENIEKTFRAVEKAYAEIPEEIRADQYSDDYRNLLIPLVDEEYLSYWRTMTDMRESAGLQEVIMAFPDDENGRLVVVFDADDPDAAYLPGQWFSEAKKEIESKSQINRIVHSPWYLPLGYGRSSGWTASDYLILNDSKGNFLGYIIVNNFLNDFVTRLAIFIAIYLPSFLVIVLLGALMASRGLQRVIIKPLESLTGAARKYTARDKVNETAVSSYFDELKLHTGNEIEELWTTMVDMEVDVAETMKRIRTVTAEQEQLKQKQARLSAELDIATKIQAAVLPREFPAFPDRTEFELFASMTPAKEVGGDFYDFFLLDEDHLGLVVADVSGKGVPAALFMMISKQLLKNRALEGGTPAEVLDYVNEHLCEDNENDMFVTIWFGILTLSTGEVIASSAGHEYPVIGDSRDGFHIFTDPHGLVCGAVTGFPNENYTFTLEKGSTLFLYTDGVPEAHNEQDELFDMDRIVEALSTIPEGSPEEMIHAVRGAVDTFAGSREQFDDITMLCVKYFG